MGDHDEIDLSAFYGGELPVAPGWKVGGWPPWGRTDPVARFCIACDAAVTPLLTIASGEWDGGTTGWIPYEDRDLAARGGGNVSNPPEVQVGSADHLHIYVCPNSPAHPCPGGGHPHTDLIQ
ncbi:hypothetical protein J0910_19775 [Nocardiopsis sp. CNT-189]|uniref:hypothetical protein n=1 Tax=Nocardiopsis oceanisediminis TaxID=2816862 RepID=UPI003B3689AB